MPEKSVQATELAETSYLPSQGVISKAVWTEFTVHFQEGGPAHPDQAAVVLTPQ